MLIRSQDKKCIYNLENMEEISIIKSLGEKNFFLTISFQNKSREKYYIGNYPTEKRAIEVLDEICNAYLNLNIENVGMNSSMGYFGGYVKNGIFQMPNSRKEEVFDHIKWKNKMEESLARIDEGLSKPRTNIEKIHNMNEEELSEFIIEQFYQGKGKETILQWLQQSAD